MQNTKPKQRKSDINMQEYMARQMTASSVQESVYAPRPKDIHAYQSTEFIEGESTQMPVVEVPADEYGHLDYKFDFSSEAKAPYGVMRSGELNFSITERNSNVPIDNIVSIEMSNLYMQSIPRASASYPDFFFHKKLYLLFTNLPTDSAHKGTQGFSYHFSFTLGTLNSVAIECTPDQSEVAFKTPIPSLSSLECRFMVPYFGKVVPMRKDIIRIAAVAGTNPGRFTILGGDTATELTNETGALTTAVSCFVLAFASNDATANVAVASSGGFVIDNVVSSTVIQSSQLNFAAVIGAPECDLYIAKNRVSFAATFISLRKHTTQRLTYIR